jgi:hypothetical protein
MEEEGEEGGEEDVGEDDDEACTGIMPQCDPNRPLPGTKAAVKQQ